MAESANLKRARQAAERAGLSLRKSKRDGTYSLIDMTLLSNRQRHGMTFGEVCELLCLRSDNAKPAVPFPPAPGEWQLGEPVDRHPLYPPPRDVSRGR